MSKEKIEKLTGLLVKIFEKVGRFKKESLHVPTDANGSTKGYFPSSIYLLETEMEGSIERQGLLLIFSS